MDEQTLAQIRGEFPAAEQAGVAAILRKYEGPEPVRVVRDILKLSNGSAEAVARYAQFAQRDYRDILYWAEYYETDPLVRGRDPRELVQEILRKLNSET